MVRIARDWDLPFHYDASPLKAAVRVVGWPAGILAIVAGIAIYVAAGSVVAEAVGAILVLIGVALVVALIRCRLYEVTVGERITKLHLGAISQDTADRLCRGGGGTARILMASVLRSSGTGDQFERRYAVTDRADPRPRRASRRPRWRCAQRQSPPGGWAGIPNS